MLTHLRDRIADPFKDVRLNLPSVLQPGALTPAQRWGVAVAAAVVARNTAVTEAIVEAARAEVGADVIEDACVAATIMAMNNVYYRFRHQIGKESYGTRPARLRMTRISSPATNKVDFELFSLAVSALAGCESCVRSHEEAVLAGGLTEEHVHDAVRIAAVVQSAALAHELSEVVADATELGPSAA